MEETKALAQVKSHSVDDIEVTAIIPEEMVENQNKLIQWCESKLSMLRYDVKELEQSIEIAIKNNWAWLTYDRLKKKVEISIVYYEKLKAALEAGYYIVPNFRVQIFAIRSDKNKPNARKTISQYATMQDFQQSSQDQPIGKGEYRNPTPLLANKVVDTENKIRELSAVAWQDKVAFPVFMGKPVIMEATSRAMALKIFDRFGVLPASNEGDPIIVGQIVRTKGRYNRVVLSFMIAWHLNTAEL